VVSAPKFSYFTPILRSPNWHQINKLIEYKLLSLTYKVLTISQADHTQPELGSVYTCRTRSSSVVAVLARPSVGLSSPLQIANPSVRYTSPYWWNQLLSSFREPYPVHSASGSPHLTCITSSQCPSKSLSSSITPSAFHSWLERILYFASILK